MSPYKLTDQDIAQLIETFRGMSPACAAEADFLLSVVATVREAATVQEAAAAVAREANRSEVYKRLKS